MLMEDEKTLILDDLVKAVGAWNLAMEAFLHAGSGGEASLRRAERHLQAALRGLTLRRWEQLQSGSASIRDSRASRDAHRAARGRAEVLEAVAAVERARAESAHEMTEALGRLANAASRLAPFGRCAERITGLPRKDLEYRAADRTPSLMSLSPIRVSAEQRRNEMATRDQVRDFQRRIAKLDVAHSKAKAHLAAAEERRAAVIAAQDVLVAEARQAVDAAVAEMAREVGVDLAVSLTGRDASDVRRVLRRDGVSAD